MPKGPSSFPKRDPFAADDESENDQTALESGWEDEASTTVAEQGDVAEKIRSLGGATPKSSLTQNHILDEPTVDDRRANGIVASSPKPQSSTGARLLITAGNDKGAVLAIQPGKAYTVGRGVDNDLVLTDIAVSRKHFDLKHDAGAWVLVDRRSGNGTLVNGNIEDNAFMLANGDVIEIGNTTFRFEMPNGLPRAHPASAMETPATASMDASMDSSMDAPLASARVPINRRPTEDDDDDEQSTVAGKPIREEMAALTPPQTAPQPPPRARPPTLGPPPSPVPPAPPAPPAPRLRAPTGAPPLPVPIPRAAAPMPYGGPSAPTLMPQPQPRFDPQSPTILGDAMGIPLPQPQPLPLPQMLSQPLATTIPGQGAPQPGMFNNGYPMPSGPQPMQQPPMGMHPSMSPYSDYGMQGMRPYASTQPRGMSRNTKLAIGAAGLAVAAALLTMVIIQVATSDDERPASKPEPAAGSAGTKPTASTAPTKPTVEPIKPTTTTPTKPTVEPIKPTTTATTEPAKTEPVKTEPKTAQPTKTRVEDPGKKEREAAARREREEAAAAKREREAAARKEREEAAARKREEAAANATSTKRVGADSSGVKDKADGLYRAKNFAGAAAALKAAAKGDDASELKSLAAVYENLGKAYNVGMAPGTPAKQAFDLLVKAKNFDNRAGGAFTSDITARLSDIASKAAVAFMADKDYVRARNAVAVAESGGKGNSSTQGVKSSLESAAGKLFKEAQAEMSSDEKAAREKLKQVQQMVDSKSQWHQKAGKLLSGG